MWCWIFFGLLALIIIALSSHLIVHVKYIRVAENDELDVKIFALFGLFRRRYRFPAFKLKGFVKGIALRLKKSKPKKTLLEADKTLTLEEFMHVYNSFKDLKRDIAGYKEWITDTLRHVRLDKVLWRTRLGLGEAPDTAVSTGIVWSIKSCILAQIVRHFKLEVRPELSVDPDYNGMSFQTQAELRLHVSLFRLAYSLFMLAVRMIRREGALRFCKKILSNEPAK